jgi:hypothetical protein
MKRYLSTFLLSAMALCFLARPAVAADLTDQDKQFLAAYEKTYRALVADDLASAKKAAAELGAPGETLAGSTTLKDARAAFSDLSGQAEKLAAGQTGYFVMHCPMVKKDWVQTSKQVANPYAPKTMLTCGEIKG